jgi:hypothetical protein
MLSTNSKKPSYSWPAPNPINGIMSIGGTRQLTNSRQSGHQSGGGLRRGGGAGRFLGGRSERGALLLPATLLRGAT